MYSNVKVMREHYQGTAYYVVYSRCFRFAPWYRERDFIMKEDAIDFAKTLVETDVPDEQVWP